ncbi:hypothetical protein DOQ08_00813 [Marinobacter litoralis]|uniref:Uncharacterized protein n=1 Tax=Marinobacter litoralis TaxID=187981 RepID=A0A3M2RLH5_9GAMM|nr:hypothetical protein [Marinobacter litoralis]RMJ06128.1 hypothetical protein DOQ08_00813 [Marinobacter litoralis]
MEPQVFRKDEVYSVGGNECSMRVPVGFRALWALKDMTQLMNPITKPRFFWQVICSNLARCATFAQLLMLAILAWYLAHVKALYVLNAVGYALFLYFAWAGYQKEKRGQSLSTVIALFYCLILLNLASFQASFPSLKGEKEADLNARNG